MKPLLFIPCYNHTEHINILLNNIKKYYTDDILIINDGSTDKLSLKSKNKNLTIKKNKINMGKGYCIIKASEYMLDNNYTHLIVMDSDNQHDPTKLNDFLIQDSKIELVYGRRKFRKPMPFSRIFSNTITSLIISILCHKRIYDAQCGYRRYSSSLFINQNCEETGYQFESEILLKKINKNSSVSYVDISTIYNKNLSSMHYFNDTLKFIRCIIKNII